jgi:hypothetical protein
MTRGSGRCSRTPTFFEFLLELDYIFKWVHPVDGERYFRFWVAPVTMVFESAHTVRIDIESQLGDIEVADLFRESPETYSDGRSRPAHVPV